MVMCWPVRALRWRTWAQQASAWCALLSAMLAQAWAPMAIWRVPCAGPPLCCCSSQTGMILLWSTAASRLP